MSREPPGNIKAIAINIHCSSELGGNTLLLKTLYALVTRYREIKRN